MEEKSYEELYKDIGYSITDDNYTLDKKSNKVSKFLVKVINQHIVCDKNKKLCKLELEGINKNGENLEIIIIDLNEVRNSNWINSNWGFENQIFHNMRIKFEKLLRHLSANIKKIEQYNQIGFRKINNKYVYIHGGGVIG